jgi:hypothetical protein
VGVSPKKKGMSPNALLAVGLGACAALVVVTLAASRFLKTEPPPPPPPPPPTAENTVMGQLRYTEGFYKAELEDDFKRYQLTPEPVSALAQPNPYLLDLSEPQKLKYDHDKLDTAHFHLATHVRKEWATTPDGQSYRYEHIVLSITNKTDKPLAYRVETSVDNPEKCRSKGSIPHDAIALKPHETVERTECLWRPSGTLTVKRIEGLEVSPLGYVYVSRLTPAQVLIDERTSMAHTVPKGAKPCGLVPWREIQAAAQTGTEWADVLDFYSRHNCDDYSFYRGYKRWTTPGTLPAHATVEAAQAPATPAAATPPAAH